VMRAAHTFKGELSYLGAEEATHAARALEDMGHEKDLSRGRRHPGLARAAGY
jgi:HPt (histidine-containing phosphotransfer) domain-containing protein